MVEKMVMATPTLRQAVKKAFPEATKLLRRLKERYRGGSIRSKVFEGYYEANTWGDEESRSGEGSNASNTKVIAERLPSLLRTYNVRTFLDIPCGDFFWMKNVDLGVSTYIGADLVDSMLTNNRKNYASDVRRFERLDIVCDPLPRVDLVFCRDLFIHLPFHDIATALSNLKKSGSTYLLTTTYTNLAANEDVFIGGFRPINLQKAPFSLSTPLEIINEGFGVHMDRSLGLWRIADL